MPNHDQQPPWGKKHKPQTPEEVVAQLINKLQDFFADKKSPPPPGDGQEPSRPASPFANIGKLLTIILIIVVLQGAFSAFFKIAPNEVGVILRLGQYSRTTPPGLHFKIPYIDKLYKVDVESIRKEEFGFRSRTPGQQGGMLDKRGFDMESLTLTADTNVIDVAWIVQYKVADPYAFLFFVSDITQAVRDISESVTRRVIGNMDFDYLLSNRDLLANSVKIELQNVLDAFFPKGTPGVTITTVQFQDINPPDQVKPAFNEVNEADQDMKRLVNEAQEYYNRVIPKAAGDAKKIVEEAYGYQSQRINNAQGETQRFIDILAEYRNAPEVTRTRMYLETMKEILPNVQTVYIIDKDQQSPIPLLNLTTPGPLQAAQQKPQQER